MYVFEKCLTKNFVVNVNIKWSCDMTQHKISGQYNL